MSKKTLFLGLAMILVLGLGLSVIFVSQRLAQKEKKVTPEESLALGPNEECSRCCYLELGCYGTKIKTCSRSEPYNECPEDCDENAEGECVKEVPDCDKRLCRTSCKPRKIGSCPDKNSQGWPNDGSDDCWVAACEDKPPPTPTPSPEVQCLDLLSDPDTAELKKGDTAIFKCQGKGINRQINHFEYRVKIKPADQDDWGDWKIIGQKPKNDPGINYKILKYGKYRVQCRVCISEDSTKCTQWGKANM